jgi:O-antigen/teichoic acid export membrane protein
MITSTAFSIGTKALQAVATFATVHKLVQLWGLSGYGLWVTLSALALYISLFDMGVGYSVKNRISEAWSRGDPDEAAPILRSGVAVYAIASIAALACGLAVTRFVSPFKEHAVAASILWAACVASFFLSYNNMVLQGLARFKTFALVTLVAPCIWFAVLQLWPRGHAFSLETGAAIYASALVAQALLVAQASRRAHAFPLSGWHRTAWSDVRPLLATGAQFLALQIAAFVLNGCGSFVVYRALGGEDTARYDAANKLFSVFMVAFSTLIAVAWTEISKAKAAGDLARLIVIRRVLHAAAFGLFIAVSIACYASAPLTHALTGVAVPSSSALAFASFVGLQMLSFTSAVFLNAFERLRAQIIAALISIPVFFVTAFVLLHLGLGMPSVPMASAVAVLPSLATCFVIARRLVSRPAGLDLPIAASV